MKKDLGKELTPEVIDALLKDNFGVNCFLLLGEGSDPEALRAVGRYLESAYPKLERALYSGREEVEDDLMSLFDYVKVGPYKKEFGPLNERTTNQRLYYHREDITSRFWRK